MCDYKHTYINLRVFVCVRNPLLPSKAAMTYPRLRLTPKTDRQHGTERTTYSLQLVLSQVYCLLIVVSSDKSDYKCICTHNACVHMCVAIPCSKCICKILRVYNYKFLTEPH